MPVPNPKIPKLGDTLLSYLKVQENFDRRMYALLRRSASDAQRDIEAIIGRTNIGSVIRREQLMGVKRAMHERMSKILADEGFLIAAGNEKAAAAAIASFEAYEKMLMQSVLSDAKIKMYLASARKTSEAGIAAARQRMLGASYIPLSQQVYRTTELTNGVVDRYVESALARGMSARELANGVKSLILPNVRGGVSYAAMRLGRTEINNSFHAVAAEKYRNTPWVTGSQWNLSGSHPIEDDCDVFAGTAHYPNGEPGVFLPEDVPQKPHPNCLCFITPVTVSRSEFLDQYFAGAYDSFIDDVIARDGFII